MWRIAALSLLLSLCATALETSYLFPYTAHIKQRFEDSFHEKCDKYPFVQHYNKLLTNPPGKYITFVMQQPNLRNGGLGDRIAGLSTAMMLSLRFNRTLIIRSGNYMHLYFRPFHPTDIHAQPPQYTWENWMQWSGYKSEWSDRDETEYDLWDCINNTGVKSDHCAMEGGDVGTSTILYRSNRCYLCRYDGGGHGLGQDDLRRVLGVKASDNLFEVDGCLLRLALWPTENMWSLVDRYYAKATQDFGMFHPDLQTATRKSRKSRRLRSQETGLHQSMGDLSVDGRRLQFGGNSSSSSSRRPDAGSIDGAERTHLRPISSKSSLRSSTSTARSLEVAARSTELPDIVAIVGDEEKYLRPANSSSSAQPSAKPTAAPSMGSSSASDAGTGSSRDSAVGRHEKNRRDSGKSGYGEPFYQLAVHFRCGDTSFHRQGDKSGCEYTPGMSQSSYMLSGNPVQLAECSARVMQNHSLQLMAEHRRILPASRLLELGEEAKRRNVSLGISSVQEEGQFVLVYVTSDSPFSSQQIQRTMQYNHSVVAPPGCHVELDSSLQCLELTLTQWFVLSLSAHIAVQTSENGTPVSAYSRYAAIYNLRPNVLQNGLKCDDSMTHHQMSRLQQGNWFC